MKHFEKLKSCKGGTSGWTLIVARNLLVFLIFLTVIELFGSCRPARSIQTIEQADTSSSSASDLRITEAISDSLLSRLHLEFDTLEVTIPKHHFDTPGQIHIKAIKGSVCKERKSITLRQRNTQLKDTMGIHTMKSHCVEDETTANATAGAHHILGSMLPLLLIAGTAICLFLRMCNRK